MKHLLLTLSLFLAIALVTHAAEKPYDESADAKADVRQALAEAGKTHQAVLMIFGANWCPDCLVLDRTLKQAPSAALVARDFKVVKVDVGQKNRNVDLAAKYGVSFDKGIPTVAILSSKGQVLYVTRDGELADARHMGDDGIYQFFKRFATDVKR